MNIGIIGGTQGVGLEAIKQALAAGHSVTALARTPSKIDVADEKLAIVQGDALNATDVDKIIAGQDVIINSLGATKNNPDNVCTIGTRLIIKSMKNFGVKRLLTVTALGAGDSANQVPFLFKVIMKIALKKAYIDKEAQEQAIMDSGLEWVIVRPGGLTNDEARGEWIAFLPGDARPNASRITRPDVATFVLAQLESEQYLGKAVGLVGY